MRALKRFGQHFLEPAWVDRMVEAVAPAAGDVFLEIGPGQGALTMTLAGRARAIVAVEIDYTLAPVLARKAPANVTVVQADFLETDVTSTLPPGPFRVAGNLPYNISTPILARLLKLADDGRRITDATVMLQREVADRLASAPNSKDWGVLSACQRLRARVDRLLDLPPGAFRPAPKVHSAVVRLRYHPAEPAVRSVETYEAMVRSMFLQRRKVLSNSLAPFAASRGVDTDAALEAAGIDPRRRPETLDVVELARLSDVFTSD